MCGIAGLFNFKGSNPDIHVNIKKMTRTLRHRGPDDEGYLLFHRDEIITAGSEETSDEIWETRYPYTPRKRIEEFTQSVSGAFGFRRLSILDLSPAGHQPMCTPDGDYWIVFNGEIYNYIELRKELQSAGYHFVSETDTEVLLNAYAAWGEDCLHKLNGMWSFMIYDKKRNSLFGARDRFGVKPFYYINTASDFAFASEQKAFLHLPFFKRKINHTAVYDLFVNGKYESSENGLFAEIKELFPSSVIKVDLNIGKVKTEKYFQLTINENYEQFNIKKAAEYYQNIRELCFNAIKLRLRSDVPVGSCLSGGLDSSTIVCLINEISKNTPLQQVGKDLKVFTAVFNEKKYDESMWASEVVKHTNTEWHKILPQKEHLTEEIETLTYCQDLPLGSVSTYAQYKVLEKVSKEGIKVVMDGQGGDEIFAGYPHYYISYWNEHLKNREFNSFFHDANSVDNGIKTFTKHYLKSGINHMPGSLNTFLNRLYFEDQQYVNPEFIEKYSGKFNAGNPTTFNSLNKNLAYDITGNTLKHYLKCEDRSSMWFSVESRTPFADDIELIKYLYSIPGIYKIRNGEMKYLLRESMKGIIPENVRNRQDKKGYTTPNNEWVSDIKDEFRQYFTNDLEQFINVKKLLKNYDSFFDLKNKPENYRIFKFIGFAVWNKVFKPVM